MLAAPFANEWIGERVTVDGNGASDPAGRVLDEWRNAAYNCFSSGHKFCREVCPVMQVTRDETPHARPRSTRTSWRWRRAS